MSEFLKVEVYIKPSYEAENQNVTVLINNFDKRSFLAEVYYLCDKSFIKRHSQNIWEKQNKTY